jgi:hypothetical protein
MDKIEKKSPDGKHTAVFIVQGEIRYGPMYFSLSIDQKPVEKRIFGDEFQWSPDSRYLAVQEWLTMDYEEGPRTRAILFDLEQNRLGYLKAVNKGFATDFVFDNNKIIYKQQFKGMGRTEEVEVDISQIVNWRGMNE